MSHPNAPFGFRPILWPSGRQTVRRYAVDSSNSREISRGDMVEREVDGNVTRGDADCNGACVGACIHVEYIDAYGMLRRGTYLPASTAGFVYVPREADVQYIGMGEAGVAMVATDGGANCDINDGTPAVTGEYGGHSIQTLDLSGIVATTALMRLEEPYPAVDNVTSATVADSQYGLWICAVAEHFNRYLAAAGGQVVGLTT